ncbi:MAG: hypothetical protein QNJ41_16010 [Xenococcaceae cyanobacterium MO_188.B32]|nr:hypothetical protein [Xenococcaceae cyanobacterium MO_188.B32]
MNILTSILNSTKATIILFFCCLGYFCLNSSHFFVFAQTEKPNPLEITEPDPLLPPKELDRPLTSIEKRLIREKTLILNERAQLELAAGNKDKAFALWYRELRLQRALGTIEEIIALGRVGEIAWQQNLSQELNTISDRLLAIEQKINSKNTLDLQLLDNLGKAYQQVRSLDHAVVIYQKILANNLQEEQKILETLGKLHLARFDYERAADTYEKLLKSVRDKQQKNSLNLDNNISKNQIETNLSKEELYLNKLVEIYARLFQPVKEIEIKQQLRQKYLAEQKTEQLAALNISLATNYQTLKQPEKAQKYYEDAFALAWSLQQFALAEEALQKLALLYQEYQQQNSALKIYQELIKVEQKAYDYFNLMNTYAQIGQIYEQLNNDREALIAYKKGLELAISLNYRVDYFQNKIEQLENN